MTGTASWRSGRTRAALSAGSLLGIGALLTAALVSDQITYEASLSPGDSHQFNLQVAGSEDPNWRPAETDWLEGNPDAVVVGASTTGGPLALAPGASREYRISVRNESPELGSTLALRIEDPNPESQEFDPDLNFIPELFTALEFTVLEDDDVLLQDIAGPTPELAFHWDEDLIPREEKHLVVRVTLPSEVGNDFNGSATQIALRFDGTSQFAEPVRSSR